MPGTVNPRRAGHIVILNKVTAIAAGVSILTGLLLLFVYGRPAGHYLGQGIFLGKLGLFAVLSTLVVMAKPLFVAAAQGTEEIPLPLKVRLLLLADLCGLPIIGAAGFWVATH